MSTFPVVFVDGDDATLVSEALSKIVGELVGTDERELVVEDHRGDGVDLAAVADSCATPPFLTDRRVVVVRDAGRFLTEDVAPLIAYLDDPLPTTVLVLGAGEGPLAPKLLAAVKAKGHVESTKVSQRESAEWVRQRLRGGSVKLDAAAERVVREHFGEDVSRLGSLLEVLAAAYGEGASIGAGDLGPYLGEAGSVAPWDFTDAIDSGRTEEALANLRRLLGAGDRHPLQVLALLHRHVQSLLRVDDPSIRTESEAAEAMGIAKGRSTYPAKKALNAAQRWRTAGIAEAIGLLAQADLDLKGATGIPAEAVLEVLVARLCLRARARGAPVRSGR
jgi:DNA polymerase-3 subunit delta